jgi:ferredoxin
VVTAGPAWRVTVGDRCIGAGSCAGVAPERFVLDEDGRSHPVGELIEADGAVLDAVAFCPVEAISVRDAATGEPVEP